MNCPNCKSTQICEILYGYMDMTDDLQKEIDQGSIKLGGCIIGINSPKYNCNQCLHQWGVLDD